MTLDDFKVTELYELGRCYRDLGKVLMNPGSTLIDIGSAASKVNLRVDFRFVPNVEVSDDQSQS